MQKITPRFRIKLVSEFFLVLFLCSSCIKSVKNNPNVSIVQDSIKTQKKTAENTSFKSTTDFIDDICKWSKSHSNDSVEFDTAKGKHYKCPILRYNNDSLVVYANQFIINYIYKHDDDPKYVAYSDWEAIGYMTVRTYKRNDFISCSYTYHGESMEMGTRGTHLVEDFTIYHCGGKYYSLLLLSTKSLNEAIEKELSLYYDETCIDDFHYVTADSSNEKLHFYIEKGKMYIYPISTECCQEAMPIEMNSNWEFETTEIKL